MVEKQSYRPPETTKHDDDYYAEFEIDQEQNMELPGAVENMFAHAEMYRLPGDAELTKKDFVRLHRSHERMIGELKTRVLNDRKYAENISYESITDFADNDVWSTVMKARLESKDKHQNLKAVFDFLDLPADLQKKFSKKIETVIDNHLDSVARVMVSEVSSLLPVAEKISSALVKKIRAKVHAQIHEAGKKGYAAFTPDLSYGLIPFADEEVQRAAAHEALAFFQDDPLRLREIAASLAQTDKKSSGYWVFQAGLIENITKNLAIVSRAEHDGQAPFIEHLERMMPVVPYINPHDRQIVLKTLLNHPAPSLRWKAVQELEHVSRGEQDLFLKEKIATLRDIFEKAQPYSTEMFEAMHMVVRLDLEARKNFFAYIPNVVKSVLARSYVTETNALLAQLVNMLPIEQQPDLWNLIVKNTLEALQSGTARVSDTTRSGAAMCVRYMPEAYQHTIVDAVCASIEEQYPGLDFYAAHQINRTLSYFPPKIQGEILKKKIKKEEADATKLQALAASTPLYKNQPEHFFRKDFKKDGSTTTLLDRVPGSTDESLKERVILRHITPAAYDAWKRIYENVDFWRTQGFEYVPIEPIISVRLDTRRPNVTVAARVIRGPSAYVWQHQGCEVFMQEIKDQQKRILSALNTMGYEHGLGHKHEGNFVLLFQRSENGEIMFDHPPRLYMIDFDQGYFVRK